MAITKYSDEYAKSQESPIARRMNSSYEGSVRFIHDKYTLSGDLVGGTDEICFGRIPAGAKVLDCIVTWTDLDAAGGTIDVGYTGALDAFHADKDVTTAGSARFAATVGATVFTAEKDLIVKIDGDTDATSGSITVTLLYILD